MRVLILAYLFPPIGSSGVQRTLKYVKYLQAFGWKPIVVTSENGTNEKNLFLKEDVSLLQDIPPDVEVIRIACPTQVSFEQVNECMEIYQDLICDKELKQEYNNIFSYLERNTHNLYNFIKYIDGLTLWTHEVLNRINDYVNMTEIDVFYSTSGPCANHFLAYELKRRYDKPWIADFRDEWSNNPYSHYTKDDFYFRIIREIENSILQSSDKIITVSSMMRENYIKGFGVDAEKIVAITNGYDEEDFIGFNPMKSLHNEKFTIVHNGLVYGGRTIEPIIKAVAKLVEANLVNINEIEVIFPETDNDKRYKTFAKKLGVLDSFHFVGYHSHKDSIRFLEKANLLLLLIGSNERTKSVYTSKFFEYLRAGKSILALSPKGSLVEEVLLETKRGVNVGYEDVDAISEAISHYYNQYKKKENTVFSTQDIETYSRRNLCKELVVVLNEIESCHKKKIRQVFFLLM